MSYYLFTEDRGGVDQVGHKLYDFAEQVINGELHPLEFKLYLNRLKEVIDEVEEAISHIVLTEGEKYNGDSIHGYRVEVTNGGRYTYDHIPEWAELKERMKGIEKMAQSAYKLSSGFDMAHVVNDDGISIPPAYYKPTKTYVKLQKGKGA